MTIRIEPLGAAEAGLWRATVEVSLLFADVPWVIIAAHSAGSPPCLTNPGNYN